MAGDDDTAPECPGGCGHPMDYCRCPPPTDEQAEATLLDHFPDAKVIEMPNRRNR